MKLSSTSQVGLYANRPAFGIAGRLYFATDTASVYLDTGTAWQTAIGGRVLISEQSPTGTTVTWNSIPSGYSSLEVEVMGRTDKASVSLETVNIYFNNDTTLANYYRQNLAGSGSTPAALVADDSAALSLPAATATANYAGYGKIFVPDYGGTTFHKMARILAGRREGASTATVASNIVFWENTSAITRIDLITTTGGNFVSGTKARLYGVV